jgi:hypothetical protein
MIDTIIDKLKELGELSLLEKPELECFQLHPDSVEALQKSVGNRAVGSWRATAIEVCSICLVPFNVVSTVPPGEIQIIFTNRKMETLCIPES